MNKITVLFCCILFPALLSGQNNNFNLELLSSWDDETLPIASPGILNLQYNSCWGMAVNDREYAIMGGAAHVLIFDVTNPFQPQLAGKFQGRSTVVPREFKSYKNRFYAVADGGSSNDGLMIFDMSNVETGIVQTYWDTTFFKKIHTIALDTTSGRIYLNGGNADNGIIVLDASQNPDAPVFLAHPSLPGGYVHDCYVRNDTVYASSGNDGYYIFDFKDPANPILIAQNGTGGYNHNSWLTLDGKYAYYAEEIPQGLPIRIVDLQNLAIGEIEIVGSFLDNLQEPDNPIKRAIPHNVYIKGDLLFDSQYEDGLLVYDISDRLNPVLIAHYDTHEQNTIYNGYYGNWGNYPWLPSGTIICSDMQNGLFLFRLATAVGAQTPVTVPTIQVSPNPVTDFAQIKLNTADSWRWQLRSTTGAVVSTGQGNGTEAATIQLTSLQAGVYFITAELENGARSISKLVKH